MLSGIKVKTMESINFDRTKLKELKQLYSIAVKDGRESFMYEGHELLTSYAKYLIEFLTDRLSDDVNTEEANQ